MQLETVIKTIIAADVETPAAQKALLLRAINRVVRPEEDDKILSRSEVAARLRRSTRTVDLLAEQGILRRVRLPGRRRGLGYRESEIQKLIEGNADAVHPTTNTEWSPGS